MYQQYLGCCTKVQCCSSLPSPFPNPSTLPHPTQLPSTVCLMPHPTSLPHPNPLLSSLGLRPNPFCSHSCICYTYFPCHAPLLSTVRLKPHPFLKHVFLCHTPHHLSSLNSPWRLTPFNMNCQWAYPHVWPCGVFENWLRQCAMKTTAVHFAGSYFPPRICRSRTLYRTICRVLFSLQIYNLCFH